jgi:hypothetical protein
MLPLTGIKMTAARELQFHNPRNLIGLKSGFKWRHIDLPVEPPLRRSYAEARRPAL